jgi:lipid-binding SYLF domain-containing protein
LVFLSSWRAGVFAGGVLGHGFAIAKTPSGKWSAPCFVNIKKMELGAFFGVEKVSTFSLYVYFAQLGK